MSSAKTWLMRVRIPLVASRDGFGRCPPAPEKGWSQALVVNLRASHLPEGQARAISKFLLTY
jgi:hypothetical protein